MPVFVFVGNPLQKVVRDRETGARRMFKADREEADQITMKSRDGKVAVDFVRDQPVRVEHAGLVERLRNNNHFRELTITKAAPGVTAQAKPLPAPKSEAEMPLGEREVPQGNPQPQPDMAQVGGFRDTIVEGEQLGDDAGGADDGVRIHESPQALQGVKVVDGADVSDA